MTLHENPQGPAADGLTAELMSVLGTTTTPTDGGLLIENLDQCANVTPAWTYCGS